MAVSFVFCAKRRIAGSQSEVALQQLWLCFYLRGGRFVHNVSVVDDVGAIGKCERGRQILLDQHNGLPCLGEITTGCHEVSHDHRCQALERLVQQNKLRLPDKRARDRQHLLFAARRSVPELWRRAASRGKVS